MVAPQMYLPRLLIWGRSHLRNISFVDGIYVASSVTLPPPTATERRRQARLRPIQRQLSSLRAGRSALQLPPVFHLRGEPRLAQRFGPVAALSQRFLEERRGLKTPLAAVPQRLQRFLIRNELPKVSNWILINKLSLNLSKIHYLLFHRVRQTQVLEGSLGNKRIQIEGYS